MKNIIYIRRIFVSTIALIILTWAFFQNNLIAKLFILPFIICCLAYLLETCFILTNKIKIAKVFNFIFKISLLVYILGILIYTIYYAFANKSYSLLIIVAIFVLFGGRFFFKINNGR